MWNRRKDEVPNPVPTSQPPAPSTLAREGIPLSTLPARNSEYEAQPVSGLSGSSSRSASIGKSVVIKGQLFAREDLFIDGEIEGSVEMLEHRVTVGPNGKVVAGIKAREIVVLGTIHGNVEASDKIEIKKEAKLVGDIRTQRIVIEDGAFFKGSIDIAKAEPKPAVAARPPAAAPATTVAASAAGVTGTEAKRQA
jgi:cytoskeletal protein CcmA (bactofilin family)